MTINFTIDNLLYDELAPPDFCLSRDLVTCSKSFIAELSSARPLPSC